MLSLDELKKLLNEYNARFEIIYHEKPIRTVDDGRQYFDICQMAPALIVITEKGFFALIIAGDRGKVDFELIKNLLKCEHVRLANKKEVVEATGYEAGKIPLVGHPIPCVFDNRLLNQQFIYGGTGDLNYTLKIDPKDLVRINKPIAKFD